jgi:hypothetical protein
MNATARRADIRELAIDDLDTISAGEKGDPTVHQLPFGWTLVTFEGTKNGYFCTSQHCYPIKG